MNTVFRKKNLSPILVLECLLESPIDNRRALAGNIIISGGLGRLPGLGRRLLQEIDEQIKDSRYQKLDNLDVSQALTFKLLLYIILLI